MSTFQGGGGARLTGHIHVEGNEEQLRATINDIEQRYRVLISIFLNTLKT